MAELTSVIRRVLGSDDLVLTRDTTAGDVDGWDSLRMVAILVSVEKAFAVRLRSREVDRLASVGDLQDLICARRGVT